MKRSRLLLSIATGTALALYPISLGAQAPNAPVSGGAAQHGADAPAQEHGPHGHGEGHGDSTGAPPEGKAHEAGAHEGAEHEGGHHGPPVKLFGMVLGNGAQFAIKVINFVIFAGGLIFLTKGALSAAFKARAKELEDRLSQAQRDKAEGEAQMQALEAKMAGLQAELDGILQKAEVDAEAEKQRILEGARAEAATILAQTKVDIENQRKAAEAELRALVAELATDGAVKKLQAQLQGAAVASTVDRAIQQIGGLQ